MFPPGQHGTAHRKAPVSGGLGTGALSKGQAGGVAPSNVLPTPIPAAGSEQKASIPATATVPAAPAQQDEDEKNDKESGEIHDQSPGCETAL